MLVTCADLSQWMSTDGQVAAVVHGSAKHRHHKHCQGSELSHHLYADAINSLEMMSLVKQNSLQLLRQAEDVSEEAASQPDAKLKPIIEKEDKVAEGNGTSPPEYHKVIRHVCKAQEGKDASDVIGERTLRDVMNMLADVVFEQAQVNLTGAQIVRF